MAINPINFNIGVPPLAPTESVQESRQVSSTRTQQSGSTTFRDELARLTTVRERVNFSRHASKRLEMRGISFTPDGIDRVSTAIDRANEKGSRDTLVVAGELSLVVNVPSRTVVTVMGREDMAESIVTNIDSVVFA